jgi:hypothetical protein
MERRRPIARKDRRLVRHISRFNLPSFVAAAGAIVLAALFALVPAHAQGRLDARFTASLAGVQIGKGAWVIDISDDQYTAAASGKTTGLMRVFASGRGNSASHGIMVGGRLVPTSYAASITSKKKTNEVRMKLVHGNVREFVASPPSPSHPQRVPLTAAHRRGVIDPMTASLLQVAGNGNPVRPEACRRSLSIFDGRMRYDLKLAFKRMEMVKAKKGYQGPAVVCAIYFFPVAGHKPDRHAIKYLVGLRTMEAWFVPLAGTRVLVPFRVSIPTPLGVGVLQATQFVSVAQPSRPIPASARAQ